LVIHVLPFSYQTSLPGKYEALINCALHICHLRRPISLFAASQFVTIQPELNRQSQSCIALVVSVQTKGKTMNHRTLIVTVLALGFMASARAADVAGKWKADFDTQVGLQKYTFDFKVDGEKLTGKLSADRDGQMREADLTEGKITKDGIFFVETLKLPDQDLRIEFTGKVSGDEIKFTRKVGDLGSSEATAKRVKEEKKSDKPAGGV